MITEAKILKKLERIEREYGSLRFEELPPVPAEMTVTAEHFRSEPDVAAEWAPVQPGDRWGGDGLSAWFRADVELPAGWAGRPVFVKAPADAETMFLADGVHRGVFDVNHPYRLMAPAAVAGKRYHLAFEAYSGHTFPGTQPFDTGPVVKDGCRRFDGVVAALEREDVSAFVFDLLVLRQLAEHLDEHSLRRGRILEALGRVFAAVSAVPREVPESEWRPALAAAREIMAPLLALANGPTMPRFGIVAHSHIDTAWLWPLAETWRKCARTFSSMLNLMERYPEVVFLQPAPCHAEVMEAEYPGIFARMQEIAATGRWECNGAMWVEPDCNLVSGESFVRQLLVGQRSSRRMFGQTGDTLWLPDVFGYSAALPQILRGAGVEFFVTTKIGWNDSTRFPYDTFTWKGIDGSSVIAHFNNIHCWPDPATLLARWRWVQHKDSQDRYLLAYGYGDGGGGPQAEMMEVARRVRDLEGCPPAEHTTVSAFMQGVRDEMPNLPVHSGELYLELHRGTLTSIAGIKRGNRQAEFAMRDAEFLCAAARLAGVRYPADALLKLWKLLLTNQFHDILPGSSIARVNDEALVDFDRIIREARALGERAMRDAGFAGTEANRILAVNTLSRELDGEYVLEGLPEGLVPAGKGVTVQSYSDPAGVCRSAVYGRTLPALGAAEFDLVPAAQAEGGRAAGNTPMALRGDTVETPFVRLDFDPATGAVTRCLHRETGRELVRPGGALNRFLFGEDVPLQWDNWDIDEDQRRKLAASVRLTSRTVVANGPLQLRVRFNYAFGASTMVQDVVFHANSPRIDFETRVDWHERHRLLKVAFETDILADTARHEIQYGHVERPTHRNLPQDRARFEVCAHKWTDLSETGFGAALLNDGKYGVDVLGGDIRLSLLKAGTHPDPRGDEGVHDFAYAFLPHVGGFSASAVVHPAYEFNVRPAVFPAGPRAGAFRAPVSVDRPNVLIESVKWAEEGDGLIVRVYEAEKTGTRAALRLAPAFTRVEETDLLEENGTELQHRKGVVTRYVRPFQILTFRCSVGKSTADESAGEQPPVLGSGEAL